MPALSVLDQYAVFNERAARFRPDVVIVTDSPRGREAVIKTTLAYSSAGVDVQHPPLAALIDASGVNKLDDDGVPVPFDAGRRIAEALGVSVRMPWVEADRKARLIADDILRLSFLAIAESARGHGAVPVFLALDNVSDAPNVKVNAIDYAREAGFMTFDLLDIWTGKDQAALRIAPWDNHPNAVGNRVIADGLHELIVSHASELGIPNNQGRESADSN